MKTLGIKVVNAAHGKQIARGHNTQVFVVQEDDDGQIVETDISTVTRNVELRLGVGEVVTAKIECFITGVEARGVVEEVVLRNLRPRKRSLWRRMRDITTFGPPTQEYVR